MSRSCPLPPDLSVRSFSVTEQAASQLPRSRTRASDLSSPTRGVRLPVGVDLHSVAGLAGIAGLDDSLIFSHSTAALVWGIPVPDRVEKDGKLHVARVPDRNRVRRAAVIGHRLQLPPEDIRSLNGLRLTSPQRTWLDLAAILLLDDLVAAGDALVCAHARSFEFPRLPLATIADLRRIISLNAGRRGLVNARQAVEQIRVGADSPPETKLRLALVRAGLPEPELNVTVVDRNGTEVLWPDLAYRAQRLGVEYDGGHHGSEEQYLKDIAREGRAMAAGWTIVRIGREDLLDDGRGAVRKVRTALALRGEGGRTVA